MDVNNAKDLGSIIRKRRKEAGLNQSDFADLCNVGLRFISELERGKGTVQFDLAVKVANLLGIELYGKYRGE